MKRELIAPNVGLTQLPNDKFKRNRISITFMMPNDRNKATMYALLPGIMERAYEDYPDMQLLSRKLDRMYSAQLAVSTSVVGENRCMRFSIQGIKNEYCIGKENLLMELCNLVLGVIFRPCLENGVFTKNWLEVEKYKLREEIEGEVNEKRRHCVSNARRKFFKDSLNGVERLGYLEEIEDITAEQLYNCYKQMIDSARIEIFITANNADDIVARFAQAFSYQRSADAQILPVSVTPCFEHVEDYTETMDTVQGKICLMYTTKRRLTEDERYRMRLGASLFGGPAFSRLFKNVREKQSLCYYCSASFNGFTSSLCVDSGVEHQNAQRTIDAIQVELDNILRGEISQQELLENKLMYKNSLQANYDSLYGLEAWYLNEIIRGSMLSPETVIEKIQAVTAQQIKDVLSLLKLNVIYRIAK